MSNVKVVQKTNHDKMWIKVTLDSGANFKLTVSRTGETLTAALSNVRAEAQAQLASLNKWLQYRTGENNAQRFNRIEQEITNADPRSAKELQTLTNS